MSDYGTRAAILSKRQKPAHPFTAVSDTLLANNKIDGNAKILVSIIVRLARNKEGYCWAKNPYFADLFDVDDRTIQRWMRQLVEAGLVTIEGRGAARKITVCGRLADMNTDKVVAETPTDVSPYYTTYDTTSDPYADPLA